MYMYTIFTPKDALKRYSEKFPQYVFDAFNCLLSEKYNDNEIIIEQDEVIKKIIELSDDEYLSEDVIFNNGWLDVEPFYIEKNWEVVYDKPTCCDNYSSRFIFKPNKI